MTQFQAILFVGLIIFAVLTGWQINQIQDRLDKLEGQKIVGGIDFEGNIFTCANGRDEC